MEEQILIPDPGPKRPPLLTILCILTFIGSGMGFIGFMGVALQYEATIEALKVIYADFPEASYLLNAPHKFFVIATILMGASLLGAIFMWNLKKIGFHIYASAQIIYLILPFIFFNGEANPLLNVITTALFVYLYARNLPIMR